MEVSKNDTSSANMKTGLESLTKEELINKYKGLLNIAKKAKQAKDEFAEENRLLKEQLQCNENQKEADKKALLTMKETLEQFTEQKLFLSTQLDELRQQNRQEKGSLAQLRIENESLRRQIASLTTDNESLLNNIDAMENQLKQVNTIGVEQKKRLEHLEIELNRLKELESQTASLKQRLHVSLEENKALKETENLLKKSLNEFTEKYQHVKEMHTQQRQKFNVLKTRFVDVHGKLKKLKECKRVLLETQQEYAEAVSKWQNEIINGARQLCTQLHSLKSENDELLKQLNNMKTAVAANVLPTKVLNENNSNFNIEKIDVYLKDLEQLAKIACEENVCLKTELQDLKREQDKKKAETTNEKSIDNDLLERIKVAELTLEKQTHNNAQLEVEFKAIKALNTQLLDECENLKLQLKKHVLQLEESKEAVANYAKLENDLKNLNEKFAKKTLQCEKLANELAATKSCMQSSQETVDLQLRNELEKLKAQQTQDYENFIMEKSEIESKNKYLIEKLEILTAECEEYTTLKQSNEKTLEDLKQTTLELQQLQVRHEELQKRHELKVHEHTDLLAEMRELNEALKKRGDLISRQEARQNELQTEMKRLQQIEQKLKEKEQLIQQKNNELKEINEVVKATQAKVETLTAACTRSETQFQAITMELQNLRRKDTTGDGDDDAQSVDAMSITSQMSTHAEDLVDNVEDSSYEEQIKLNSKLKTFAMKLKKKLQMQTASLNELTKQLKDKEQEREALQAQNDTLMAENKKLKNTRSKQSNMLNLEIEAAEKSLSEVSAKLTAKTSELNELAHVLATKEATIVQLRKELAMVEAAKTAECEHAKELKSQIDLLQTQIKDAVHSKQNVLDSNKDLERTQEGLKMEIEDLRLQLAQSESKQIEKLEKLSTQNTQLQAKLTEMETLLDETQHKLKSATRSLDELRIEHAEYKVKAQAVLRKQQTKETTQHERELEAEVEALQQQKQQLTSTTENLSQKIVENNKQLEMLQEDNDSLMQRKEELTKLVEELRLQNEALLQEQRNLLQTQQDTLRQQRQQIEQLDECHKAQVERLENNYKNELKQLQAELTAQKQRPAALIGGAATAAAKTTTTLNNNEQQRFGESVGCVGLLEREAAEGSESTAATAKIVTLQSLALVAKRKISNSSSSNDRHRRLSSSQHDLMPLDELLNAPMHALNSETILDAAAYNSNKFSTDFLVDDNMMSSDTAVELNLELQAAKERLLKQEMRVRHLTSLLAENEQDLAKLTQMNDMLKEELRRQERAVEREQHMHNSEYLKNVIIKFITLNSVDERTRLVPVLNTILKLSRAETEMLNCVAKGQKVAETSRSWSNFLPSWGGGGGGGGSNGH